MKKVKVIIIAVAIGLSFAVSSCSEEIVVPTQTDDTGQTSQGGPND